MARCTSTALAAPSPQRCTCLTAGTRTRAPVAVAVTIRSPNIPIVYSIITTRLNGHNIANYEYSVDTIALTINPYSIRTKLLYNQCDGWYYRSVALKCITTATPVHRARDRDDQQLCGCEDLVFSRCRRRSRHNKSSWRRTSLCHCHGAYRGCVVPPIEA